MDPIDEYTWQHFAVVRDGSNSTLELFQNGISKGQVAGQSLAINISHLLIGQEQDSPGGGFDASQAFVGHIDSLRFWNTTRTGAEILAN